MLVVLGQAAIAAALIFVAGAGPTRWLLPRRLLDLGFEFEYSTIEAAVKELAGTEGAEPTAVAA